MKVPITGSGLATQISHLKTRKMNGMGRKQLRNANDSPVTQIKVFALEKAKASFFSQLRFFIIAMLML